MDLVRVRRKRLADQIIDNCWGTGPLPCLVLRYLILLKSEIGNQNTHFHLLCVEDGLVCLDEGRRVYLSARQRREAPAAEATVKHRISVPRKIGATIIQARGPRSTWFFDLT